MEIIAHRGGSFETPENTLDAFANAIALGAHKIELDIHLSKDGVPVVIHDDTLDRTTNASGPVREKTVADLRAVDAGDGAYVPQLSEVFDLVGDRVPLVLEFKAAEAVEPAIALIRAYPHLRWEGLSSLPAARAHLAAEFPGIAPIATTFGSVHGVEGLRALLEQYRASIPQAAFAALDARVADFDLERDLAAACAEGARTLLVFHTGIDRDLVETAHARGLQVGAWTVNDPDEARRLLDAGTDALTTDDPRTMLALVATAAS